jgi:hypothetical protein
MTNTKTTKTTTRFRLIAPTKVIGQAGKNGLIDYSINRLQPYTGLVFCLKGVDQDNKTCFSFWQQGSSEVFC